MQLAFRFLTRHSQDERARPERRLGFTTEMPCPLSRGFTEKRILAASIERYLHKQPESGSAPTRCHMCRRARSLQRVQGLAFGTKKCFPFRSLLCRSAFN